MFAIYQGRNEIARMLIKCEATNNTGYEKIDVNKKQSLPLSLEGFHSRYYKTARTPLSCAIRIMNSEIAKLLLKIPGNNWKEPLRVSFENVFDCWQLSPMDRNFSWTIYPLIKARCPETAECTCAQVGEMLETLDFFNQLDYS